jgi:uncharacterized membrane protein
MPTSASTAEVQRLGRSRSLWAGGLTGIGFIAFIDETVFHQLLHWHHFYDRSTTAAGLVSDGWFHALSWFATIGGMFLYADLRRKKAFSRMRWQAGILLGAGIFQLYDGTVQHKLMRLHQIRYVEHVEVYDWVWNIIAALMIVAGTMLSRHAKQESAS